MPNMYLKKNDSIATICLSRPDKRNALSYDMWNTLLSLLEKVEEDRDIRVLVLRGVDETAFSAGADISEFKSLRSTAEGAKQYRKVTMEAEKRLSELSKPTISLIQGYCVGGGCELAVACDFRFSDVSGKFGITPSKLGFVYHFAGTKNLVDLVGPAKAKDILFSGRILDAEEALLIGLIDRVYQPEEIVEKTYEYAKLLARNSQTTIHGVKEIIHEVLHGKHQEDEEMSNKIVASFEGLDYREGVQAFLEKRKPQF